MGKITVTITCDQDIFDELCSYPDSRLEIKRGPVPVENCGINMKKAKEIINKSFGIESSETKDLDYSIIGEPVVHIPTHTWGYIAEYEVFENGNFYSLALADGSYKTCTSDRIFPDTTHERLGKPTNKDVVNVLEVIKWHDEIRKKIQGLRLRSDTEIMEFIEKTGKED